MVSFGRTWSGNKRRGLSNSKANQHQQQQQVAQGAVVDSHNQSTPVRGGGGKSKSKANHQARSSTPPMTPFTPETPSPVRNVHINKPNQQQLQQQPQNQSQQVAPVDEKSIVSELTYPLEMIQQHKQKQQGATQMVGKEDRISGSTTTTTNSSGGIRHEEDNLVTRVLGLVETTCLSTFQDVEVVAKSNFNKVTATNDAASTETNHKNNTPSQSASLNKNYSFAAEWGVAPTMDEEDEPPRNEETLREESTYGTGPRMVPQQQQPAWSVQHHHQQQQQDESFAESDFFEMVLHEEDLQQSHQTTPERKKNRRWISFRKDNAFQQQNNTSDTSSEANSPQGRLGIAKRPEQEHQDTPGSPTTNHGTPTSSWPFQDKHEEAPAATPTRMLAANRNNISTGPSTNAKKDEPNDSTPAEKSPKRPFNPAAVLLRKAKNARERKKQAEKEKRYKKLLESLKDNHHKDALSTVTEEQAPEQQQIRVPGVQTEDAYVNSSDLVGSDLASVDQLRRDTPSKENTPNTNVQEQDRSSAAVEAEKTDKPVDPPTTKPNTQVLSFSQKELALKQKETAAATDKPMWKQVLDEKTGRFYYYHRITRQTTWEKPPQEQIVVRGPPKNKRYSTAEIRKLLEETPPRQRIATTKKEQIARLLASVAPANKEAVDRLVKTYEGKEDLLLENLKALSDSKPFDEPVQTPFQRTASTTASLRTGAASVYSGVSGKLSEVTPQMKNTSSRRRAYVDAIEEGSADGSSVMTPFNRSTLHGGPSQPSPSIPSNIPVPHRRRELRVEDLSDRRSAETFGHRQPRARRVLRSRTTPPLYGSNNSSSTPSFNPDAYLGDNEDTDRERETDSHANSAAMEDSISALSEPEHDMAFRQDAAYKSQRRALNEAIAKEDWDLAASLSEGMRGSQRKPAEQQETKESEWMQSDLDRFISQNDWDAVAAYIAEVRRATGFKPTSSVQSENSRGPKKRFGARSQLQHSELQSTSSWESSTLYESDEASSEEDYSYEEMPRRQRKQAFAC